MIRHNSSKITPSVVENPTVAEHLTAAEGIRVDKPITGLNHVVSSVNFELAGDNSYELRKPLVRVKDGYFVDIPLYDGEHSLTLPDAFNVQDIDGKHVMFKFTGLNNEVLYVEEGPILSTALKINKDVKYVHTANATILYNVKVDLDFLASWLPSQNPSFKIYDYTLYSSEDASSVYRLLSVYKDEEYNGDWVIEMINPEVNTFTGDATSATNFNPNILLDNPYAIRDLYKYGGNSVTQILAYTSTSNPSELDYVLENKGSFTVNAVQGVFRAEYSKKDLCWCLYTKVHILSFNPEFFDVNNFKEDLQAYIKSDDTLDLYIQYFGNSTTGTYRSYGRTVKFRHYIPAGTLLLKIPDNNVSDGTIRVRIKDSVYVIDAKYNVQNFPSAPYVHRTFDDYTCNVYKSDGNYVYANSFKWGFDVRFNETHFETYLTETVDLSGKYIAMVDTQIGDSDAEALKTPFIETNFTYVVTDTVTKYIYIWGTELDTADDIPQTVAKLTEQVSNPAYVIGESFNEDDNNSIILKAFLTTQLLNDKYYCVWEVSKDGGITWNEAVEFLEKFENHLEEIPVLDSSSSDESLNNPNQYVKLVKMVPFNSIMSNQDKISVRPDVLTLADNSVQYKYRFSIYRFESGTSSIIFKNIALLNAKDIPMFNVNGTYINSTYNVTSLPNLGDSGGTLYFDTSDSVWLKCPSIYKNYTLKYYCNKDESALAADSEYMNITPEKIEDVVENGVTYTYFKFTLPSVDTTYASTYFYNFALVDHTGYVSELRKIRLIRYVGVESRKVDVTDGYADGTSTETTTFIPSLVYKSSIENLNMMLSLDDSVGLYDTLPESMSSILTRVSYSINITIYNNSNFAQPIILSNYMLDEDELMESGTRLDMSKLTIQEDPSGVENTGKLIIDGEITHISFGSGPENDGNPVTSSLNTVNKYVVIPANNKVSITYEYRTVTSNVNDLSADEHVLNPLAFMAKSTILLAGKALANEFIFSSPKFEDSNLGWRRSGTIDIALYTSQQYTPDLVNYESYTNTEHVGSIFRDILWNLPLNLNTTNNSGSVEYNDKAILVSQKEYAFNLTTGKSNKLIPKKLDVFNKEILYYNNQLVYYGKDNNIYVSDVNSFIVPMYNTIDLTYGHEVTAVVPWRNYLAIFTTNSVHLASYDAESGYYTTKLVSTTIGLSRKDAKTAVTILNGIVFKSNGSVYKLVPNAYAATDAVLNLVCISTSIEGLLKDTPYNNFAYSTNEHYCLYIPYMTETWCYKFHYVKNVWTINKYDGATLIDYEFKDVDNISLISYAQKYVLGYPDPSEYSDKEYGDYLEPNHMTPISFSIDFGQKASRYADNKQFLGSKLILGTLSEKDIFPFDVHISTDGMSRTIHIDETTDSALWKTSVEQPGTLSTRFVDETTETIGTLRQMVLKYSGRGKTIRHVISGQSKHKFKFYSLDYKYRNLPNK